MVFPWESISAFQGRYLHSTTLNRLNFEFHTVLVDDL